MTLGAGHLWVPMFPWGMNQRWNDIWNGSCMNCGYEIKWSYDLRSYERNFCNCINKPEKIRTSTGFEPVTSRYRCDALTNWAMKPLTFGSWSFVGSNVPVRSESTMKWYMKWIMYELRIWNQRKLWSSQLWAQFLQLHKQAWKIQDFPVEGFTWFHIRSSYMIHFIYHFIFNVINKSKVVQRCLYSFRQRYSSSQWSKCCGLTRRSRVSLPQYSTSKKVFISERDQNHNSKKKQALSTTFSQYDWFISQNERSWLAITLRDKLTQAWREQRCLDSYRQRQISQSDCEITSNCGKKSNIRS